MFAVYNCVQVILHESDIEEQNIVEDLCGMVACRIISLFDKMLLVYDRCRGIAFNFKRVLGILERLSLTGAYMFDILLCIVLCKGNRNTYNKHVVCSCFMAVCLVVILVNVIV